jgi:PAS domain S-box-containing protein
MNEAEGKQSQAQLLEELAGLRRRVAELEAAHAAHTDQDFLRQLINNSPAAIAIKDLEGRLLLVNTFWAELLSATPEQVIGKFEAELFPPHLVAEWQRVDAQVVAGGVPLFIEEVAPYKGEPHDFISVKFPIRDGQGSIYALGLIATDITDRKRAEAEREQLIIQTETLYEVSRGLNTACDEKELLEILARPAARSGAFSATLMYIDLDELEKPEWLEIAANWTQAGQPPSPVGTRFCLPEFPFAGLWLRSPDEPTLVADFTTDTRMDETTVGLLKQIGVRATAIVPLVQAGRWVGAVTLNWAVPHSFSDLEQHVYRALAGLAAPAVANYRAIKQQMRLQEELVESQQRAIAELSTPIIPIMEGIVILPLVGSIDSSRARDITRSLLAGISHHRAKIVILDITGVSVVDSGVASHLDKTIQAARLKGAQTIITGISDAVAETIVDLGIDWSRLEAVNNLQAGLRVAMNKIRS